jgi:hypothetical protein
VLERLALDRQPVHVPARHEVRVLAVEQVDLHQRVLEEAVEEGTHVQVAVGVRRPVVQHERRAALRAVAREALEVGVLLGPPAHPVRLALGQLGSHRKIGLGQVEGRAVVARGLGHRRASFDAAPELSRHPLPEAYPLTFRSTGG